MLGNETTSKLAIKLALPATIIIAIVAIALGLFISQMMFTRFKAEADKERTLRSETVTERLTTTRRVMLERLREAMRVVTNTGNAKKVSVQPSVQLGDRSVPNLMLDSTSLVNNNAFVVDLAERTGAIPSVFVRDKDDNFVNIATTMKKADGTSAIGEIVERGTPLYNELRQGNASYNIHSVNGRPFIRSFEPIKEQSGGRVVGYWQVAYPVTSFSDLIIQIAKEKVLTEGFVAVADNTGRVVAKSENGDDKIIEQALAADMSATTMTFGSWNVSKSIVPDWNFTVIAGYSNGDPALATEVSQMQIWTLLTAMVISALLGGVLIFLSMSITARLDETVAVAEQIAEGNLSVDLKVTSRDEVGRLQRSMLKMVEYLQETASQADQIAAGDLNVKVTPRSRQDRFGTALRNMLDKLLNLVQSQDERDQLQRSIMKLLDEVSDVAEGDLTGQAEVTTDATGAIADAFNYMIIELREVVRRVKDTAYAVGSSTGDIRSTTEKLAEGSAAQALQIAATSSAVEEIAASIQQVSNSAQQSAEVADNALATAQNGKNAVNNNIAAMTRIRSQVQDTAKRIKKLGERSQEIDEIVQIIDELADRTSILALNASLQAAAAGDAGRGFAAVAEEVERLADRSTQATQRIAALTRTIQLETKDVLSSMEDTIHEVVTGSNLANEAGNALQEIEQVSNNLAALIQTISQTARRQAQGSESIAKSMLGISEITELVASESKHTASSVKSLSTLTEKLRGSVATFKLPDTMDKTGKLSNIGFNSGSFNLNGEEITLN